MKQFDLKTAEIEDVMAWLKRSSDDERQLPEQVARIVSRVRRGGDKALKDCIHKLDQVARPSIIYSAADIRRQAARCSPKLRSALTRAARNIQKFHSHCLKRERVCTVESGVQVWREFRAIDRVGVYVPGGRASYPSSLLMGAIPARVAGCREVVVATPISGKIAPAVAAACEIAGVDTVYAMGGAHAIAALAYGTETVISVHKIVGPGNRWVTEAKRQVYGVVDIDMPAGPSEVMVLADHTAEASYVAADMLSQLEHAPDAQAVLVTTDAALAMAVQTEIKTQLQHLSRCDIVMAALKKSAVIIAPNEASMVEMANAYAPEHLELMTRNPRACLKRIRHAGSVFLGRWSSEPLGDYATGANHTLPTSGGARAFGPLGIESFGKWMQVQDVSRAGLKRLAPIVATLADAEGLDAHKNAVLIRGKK
ncbi:MAG: histidinol dehydrogenase [Deltaproteobacteria bacterium CG11_big_fil_rev_8_21_14_0_20_47_16]|nr:MAG: histidinol dehydrogenase [Deltaproteobacteria bacterium CG11_big_fil_rev_8_21_14_0_20_47_16]